jgi:hypothetical protein
MGDIPCGGLPQEGWMHYLPEADRVYIGSMYRCIQHITDEWFMRQYRVDGIESLELRTKFLLGDSTKKTVQTSLARQEKTNELKMALWDCYNTCAVAGSEVLREFFAHIEDAVRAQGVRTRSSLVFNDAFPRSLYETFLRDAEALRIFVNKAILSVADVYRSTLGVQVIQSREGKPWYNFLPVEMVIANELSKSSDNIRVMTITPGQSRLLAETGFVWHKGDIVSPDAKILKRGGGAGAGGARGAQQS